MRLALAAVAVVLLLLIVPGAAAGQSDTTPTPTPINQPENESDSGGGGLGSILNPGRFMDGVVDWTVERATAGAVGALNYVRQLIGGVPAPGEYDDPSSWVNPQNGLWPGVWRTSLVSTAVATLMLAFAGTAAFRHTDAYERRQALKRVGTSALAVVLTWQIAPFALHFADQLSIALLPSGEQILSSPGGLASIGAAGLLGLILIYVFSSVVVLGVFALMAQYVLIHVCVAFWPVAWACRAYENSTIESIGNFIIWLFGLLIGVNVLQSLFIVFIYHVPMDAGMGGPVLGLLVIVVGLFFGLFYLPWMALQTADRAANVGLGLSVIGRRGMHRPRRHRRREMVRDRVGNVQDRVTRWRGSRRDTSSASKSDTDFPAWESPSPSQSDSQSHVRRHRRAGSMGSARSADSTRDLDRERARINSATAPESDSAAVGDDKRGYD